MNEPFSRFKLDGKRARRPVALKVPLRPEHTKIDQSFGRQFSARENGKSSIAGAQVPFGALIRLQFLSDPPSARRTHREAALPGAPPMTQLLSLSRLSISSHLVAVLLGEVFRFNPLRGRPIAP